jgi:hypothetical protein
MAILVYVLWPFGIYIVDIWYIYCGHLVDFVAIWYILWLFGIFCGHLVYFMAIWYICSRFGMLYEEKSGNPGLRKRSCLGTKKSLEKM